MAGYVVTMGDHPLAVASSLASAKAEAEARAMKYRPLALQWIERRPGEHRLQGRSGDRGRFAWTLFGVHEVTEVA